MEIVKTNLAEQIFEVVNKEVIDYIKAILETSGESWIEKIPAELKTALGQSN